MPLDWGGMAGGAQDALQELLARRLLEAQNAREAERLAMAQEAQRLDEAFRQRTQGHTERVYNEGAPKREADLDSTIASTESTRVATEGARGDNADKATLRARRDEARTSVMADPVLRGVMLAGEAGINTAATNVLDPKGEDKQRQELERIRAQGDQNVRSAREAASARQDRWVTVRYYNPATGRNEVYYGPQSQAPQGEMAAPVSAGMQDKIASGAATLEQLASLRTLYKPEYVGPAAGRLYMGSTKVPGGEAVRPEGWAEFSAANAAFKNQVIKDITGAQMSEQETKRLVQQIPDIIDPPDVWEAKLRQTIQNRARVLNAYQQKGLPIPETLAGGWGMDERSGAQPTGTSRFTILGVQ